MREIEQLKDLLVGPERRELEDLQAHIDDPMRRTRDLADVLSEAIRVGTRDGIGDLVGLWFGDCEVRWGQVDSRRCGAVAEECLAMEYKDAEARGRTPAFWPWMSALMLILALLVYPEVCRGSA